MALITGIALTQVQSVRSKDSPTDADILIVSRTPLAGYYQQPDRAESGVHDRADSQDK
jgi:hypothetical protein